MLCILFAMGLGWGVAGVGLGHDAGRGRRRRAGLAIVAAHFGWRIRRARARRCSTGTRFLRMVAVNRDIMIRTLALLAAWCFFARQGALAGDVTLAANAILNNFFLLGGFFLDGVATAAEQLWRPRRSAPTTAPSFDRAVRLSIGWSFALALIMSLRPLFRRRRLHRRDGQERGGAREGARTSCPMPR